MPRFLRLIIWDAMFFLILTAGYAAVQYLGPQTTAAVNAFQETFSLPGEPGVVGATTWYFLTSIYEDLYLGNIAAEGQYPGAAVGGGA